MALVKPGLQTLGARRPHIGGTIVSGHRIAGRLAAQFRDDVREQIAALLRLAMRGRDEQAIAGPHDLEIEQDGFQKALGQIHVRDEDDLLSAQTPLCQFTADLRIGKQDFPFAG